MDSVIPGRKLYSLDHVVAEFFCREVENHGLAFLDVQLHPEAAREVSKDRLCVDDLRNRQPGLSPLARETFRPEPYVIRRNDEVPNRRDAFGDTRSCICIRLSMNNIYADGNPKKKNRHTPNFLFSAQR